MLKAERATADLGRALEGAADIRGEDGSSYIERWGWSRGETDVMAARLRAAAQQIETYGLRGEIAQSLPPVGVAEQLGIDSDLEDVA